MRDERICELDWISVIDLGLGGCTMMGVLMSRKTLSVDVDGSSIDGLLDDAPIVRELRRWATCFSKDS